MCQLQWVIRTQHSSVRAWMGNTVRPAGVGAWGWAVRARPALRVGVGGCHGVCVPSMVGPQPGPTCPAILQSCLINAAHHFGHHTTAHHIPTATATTTPTPTHMSCLFSQPSYRLVQALLPHQIVDFLFCPRALAACPPRPCGPTSALPTSLQMWHPLCPDPDQYHRSIEKSSAVRARPSAAQRPQGHAPAPPTPRHSPYCLPTPAPLQHESCYPPLGPWAGLPRPSGKALLMLQPPACILALRPLQLRLRHTAPAAATPCLRLPVPQGQQVQGPPPPWPPPRCARQPPWLLLPLPRAA